MTPEQVRAVLEQVLDSRLVPWWYTPTLIVFGWALVALAFGWMATYVKTKAERFAKSEDLSKLAAELRHTTQVTEEIKATISNELWVRQKKWDFQLRVYSDLAENLGEINGAIAATITMLSLPVRLPEDASAERKDVWEAERGSAVGQFMARLEGALERVRRSGASGRLAIGSEARTALDQFAARWDELTREPDVGRQLFEKQQLAHRAYVEILRLARGELFGEKAPGDTR